MLAIASVAFAAGPTRSDVLRAMKHATEFYAGKVATEGGYHVAYTDDLSYGRSEHAEGRTQIETQRDGTPLVALAYLEAFDATGDPFYLNAARKAATALVAGQLCSGGWDYVIEFDPVKRARLPYRSNGSCESAVQRPPTTLDDNVTQACVRVLMRVDRALGFKDVAVHEAAVFALDSLAKAQYANGAWPQRYSRFPDPAQHPVKRASYPNDWPKKWPNADYFNYYTFNDGSISDAIDTMLEAARIYNEPRYLRCAGRGGEFILLAQMPDPQPAWAQQYDRDMHPSWARQFEPPSVTGGESQSVIRALLVLYRETGKKEYLQAVPRALEWLEQSVLPPAQGAPSEIRRRVGDPALARFYELKTNRPLYVTKGTQIHVKEGPALRVDGYQLSYTDESVISHYAVLVSASGLPALRREYEAISAKRERRPDRLHGLSPWISGDAGPLHKSVSAVTAQRIIDAMDARGAWTEEGTIGKESRLVSLQAGTDLTLVVNGQAQPLKPNDRVEVFQGARPPREKIVRSTTFAQNLLALAAYVTALRP